jgi:acetyl esterase/lipase
MAVYRGLVFDDSVGSVVLAGESAGGNLALGLCQAATIEGLALPAAVALLSPWIDLTHSGDSHAFPVGHDPTLSVQHFLEVNEIYFSSPYTRPRPHPHHYPTTIKPAAIAYAGGMSPTSPGISPLFADVPADFPPTYISTGTRDLLFSDCTRLAQKLRAQGTVVDLQVVYVFMCLCVDVCPSA